jgi:hypothetical protein
MTLLLLFKWHGSAPTTFSKRKMTATWWNIGSGYLNIQKFACKFVQIISMDYTT